jgi:hypothetical protein
VEALCKRDGTQEFFRASDEVIGSVGEFGFGPENDDV